MAVISTSPSPCPAWPSPTWNRAPLVWIGINSVVPATRLRLSRLPAWVPGGRAVHLARLRRGGDAHAAEEGVERDVDAGGEAAQHAFPVEGNDAAVAGFEVFGEEAGAGTEAVVGPGDGHGDLLDVEFENVAGFRAFDEDGAGEDVAAGAARERFVGDGFGDGRRESGIWSAGMLRRSSAATLAVPTVSMVTVSPDLMVRTGFDSDQ